MSILSGILLAASLAHAFPGTLITRQGSLLPSYDYIIVGGGTSGMTVANRLSENPDVTVLVIEAGPLVSGDAEFENLLITAYAGSLGGNRKAGYFWGNITSAPIDGLGGRIVNVPAARVVGGASAVNGMGFGRAGKRDHEDWAEFLNDRSCNWENMVKYYKRLETFTPPLPEFQRKGNVTWDWSVRGRDGPIHSTFPQYFFESNQVVMATERALGIPHTRDDGDGNNIEYVRSYSKNEHYDPYKDKRKNLHLLAENTVTKVLFEKKKAVGVEYAEGPGETKESVRAKKEVVMAAGGIFSAPLSQISGLGDKDLLEKLGVPVIADLPVIGEGFQDHAFTSPSFSLTYNNEEERWWGFRNQTFIEEQRQLYLHNRTGLFTASLKNRMLLSLPFLIPDSYRSLLERYQESASPAEKYLRPGVPLEYVKAYKRQRDILLRTHGNKDAPVDEGSGGSLALILRPLSRGYIQATSSSIFDCPTVHYRTLSHPLDLDVVLAAFRFRRKFMAQPEMSPLSPREVSPGPDKQSGEDLTAYIKANMQPTAAHACCTLGMGTATDSKMRVEGVEGLRVVDSSAWVMVPGAHATQQTAYVVAEKAADLIKDDAHD